MPKLILSNTINAAIEAVIRELVRRNAEGSKHVVIAPDSYTLSVEKLIPEYTGSNGALNIEVVSFSRLAAKELKDKNIKCLSKEGAVLILKKVINANASRLVHYGGVAGAPGFAREIFAVIAAMRNNSVTVSDLRAAIPNLGGATRTKNEDIALLYEEYLKELSSARYDSTTRLEAFLEAMPTSREVAKCDFYVAGFDTFSGKQTEIISGLARYAHSLTVGAVYTNHGANRELYPTGSVDNLKRVCREAGAEFEEEEAFEIIKEPFNTLHRNLFAGAESNTPNFDGSVVLFKEDNVFEEFNAVAHEISRLVSRKGYRYKDIAVVDCRPEHKEELKEVFVRYGIPHFIDIRYKMSGTLVYKYIVACLEAVRYGYRADKVCALIKNPLFGCDEHEGFLFENRVLAKNIGFDDFKKPFTGEEEIFEPIRKRLEEVTGAFRLPRATVGYYAEAVKTLISGEEFEERLRNSLEGVDENMVKSNLSALERIREGILEEYKELIGDEAETDVGFADMLATSATVEEIALIPRFIDSVYVGKLRESFVYRPKAIFVIGATADVLPAAGSYKAIMSELDLRRLEEANVRLYPAPEDNMREEQFAIIDLVTKADRLYIGYPMSEPNAETLNKPSSLVTETAALLSAEVISLERRFDVDRAQDTEALRDSVVTPANAYFKFMMIRSLPLPKGEEGHAAEMRMRLYNSLTPEERDEISSAHASVTPKVPLIGSFGVDSRGLGTRVSQIEKYFHCPYAHFLQYGLKLKERDTGKLKPPDIGNLVHEVLERYFGAVLGKVHIYDSVRLNEEAQKAIREVFGSETAEKFKRNALSKHTLERVEAECREAVERLTVFVRRGNFEPYSTEMQFGMRGEAPFEVETSFGKVHMRGKIDRVDLCGNKVAIFDYKTGNESGALCDVYFGKKIQLYVYLMAVMRNLGVEPAGAFYVNIRDTFTQAGADYSYKGSVLADTETVIDFDGDILERKKAKKVVSDIVPASIEEDKDSGALKVSLNKGAITAEEFGGVLDYVTKLIISALEDINEGFIERKPIEGECDRCSFRSVCGGCGESGERAFSKNASLVKREKPVAEDKEGECD